MIQAKDIAPVIRMLLRQEGMAPFVVFQYFSDEEAELAALKEAFPLCVPHVAAGDEEAVYAALQSKLASFRRAYKSDPIVFAVASVGLFFIGQTKAEADNHAAVLAKGGELLFSQRAEGRLAGKIAIVTGGAQGFGQGIAEGLLAEGATCVIADLNLAAAQKTAAQFASVFGADRVFPLRVDVTDEQSVEGMLAQTVLAFGGLDLFISNAGVLKAGSLAEMSLADFSFVTDVNYTAFFLCVKYASAVLRLQSRFGDGYTTDIIQINSKSGLSGSNKNYAYAGSKFGSIGLVQSFALELAEYGVKVNAVCPGNFYEGPLWMDPEKGLFVQYLRAGKVQGAKTVEDVLKFYQDKVPLKRGCKPSDVVLAILYLVEQQYETGQALPVTGGQNMLR